MKRFRTLANRIARAKTASAQARSDAQRLGPDLVRALVDTGLSIRGLARESGLPGSLLSRIRNGNEVISPAAFVRLTDLLGKRRKARKKS